MKQMGLRSRKKAGQKNRYCDIRRHLVSLIRNDGGFLITRGFERWCFEKVTIDLLSTSQTDGTLMSHIPLLRNKDSELWKQVLLLLLLLLTILKGIKRTRLKDLPTYLTSTKGELFSFFIVPYIRDVEVITQ